MNVTAGIRDNILGGSLLAINILIVILNLLAIFVISRFRNKNAIDLFVLGLATCDLSKGLIPVPLTVYIYLTDWYLEIDSFWCNFYGYIAFVTNSGSMLILTLMAVERYLAVVKPFIYRHWVNNSLVKIAELLAMLFTAAQSALPLVGVGRMLPHYKGAYCHFDYSRYSPGTTAYSLFIIVYGFGMILVVFVCYAFVFYKIRNLIHRHRRMSSAHRSTSSGKGPQMNLKTEKMFSYLTVVLMLLFWFSWLPFLIVVLSNQLGVHSPEKLDLFAMRVVVVNSMLNPIVYASLCKPYRRGIVYIFKTLLEVVCSKKSEINESDIWDPWMRNSVVRGSRKSLLEKKELQKKLSSSSTPLSDGQAGGYGRSRIPSVLDTYEEYRKKRRLSKLDEHDKNNVNMQDLASTSTDGENNNPSIGETSLNDVTGTTDISENPQKYNYSDVGPTASIRERPNSILKSSFSSRKSDDLRVSFKLKRYSTDAGKSRPSSDVKNADTSDDEYVHIVGWDSDDEIPPAPATFDAKPPIEVQSNG